MSSFSFASVIKTLHEFITLKNTSVQLTACEIGIKLPVEIPKIPFDSLRCWRSCVAAAIKGIRAYHAIQLAGTAYRLEFC